MPVEITKSQINDWIVNRVKQNYDREIILTYIARLERDNTSHTTVAIEIKPEDYDLLASLDFWEKSICVRKWSGWRFWRGQPRQKPQDTVNARCRKFNS